MKRGFAIQTRRKPKSIQRIFSTVIMSFPDTKTIHHMFNSVTEMLTEAFSSIWVKASVRRWQQSVQLKISYVAKSPTSREINVKEIYRMFSSKAWFNFRWNHSLVINKLCGRGRKSITEMSSIFIIHNSHRLALGISSCRCVYDINEVWLLPPQTPNSIPPACNRRTSSHERLNSARITCMYTCRLNLRRNAFGACECGIWLHGDGDE